MRPIVDQAGFDRITCSQCGDCCEHLKMDTDPAAILAEVRQPGKYFPGKTHEESVADAEMVSDMLEPTTTGTDGKQYYRCKHFRRESPDKGVCTVYARRPRMCSAFPYGKPASWRRCTWNVRVVPRLLPMYREDQHE